MNVGGVVLCGGKSSRMGSAKADLPFGPETMLGRVVRLLGDVVRPIVVVAAEGQVLPPLPSDVILAHDRQPERGPLEGIAAGLAALPPNVEAAYVTGCDVPLLVGDFVREMIRRLDEGDSSQYDIAVPRDGEFYHPLAAVYRVSVGPQVERLLIENRLRPVYLFE